VSIHVVQRNATTGCNRYVGRLEFFDEAQRFHPVLLRHPHDRRRQSADEPGQREHEIPSHIATTNVRCDEFPGARSDSVENAKSKSR
jgi:hypothetical protein